MRIFRTGLAVTALLGLGGWQAPAAVQAPAPAAAPARYAAEMERFAMDDRANPKAPCQVLFVGSSSIRLWTSLTADMAPLPVINRGFGGSQTEDVNAKFDQVVTPYRPRSIVYYAGDNDINAGKTPAQVAANFTQFLALKDAKLGATPVYFIALKPSKSRLVQLPAQAEANAEIRRLADRRADLTFIDVVQPMMQDGQPKEIFVADGLHMTPAGYAIWTAAVGPVVKRDAESQARACASRR